MTNISLTYLTPKRNQTDIINRVHNMWHDAKSHKGNQEKLMHGGSKWFHKGYIMIIQGGTK